MAQDEKESQYVGTNKHVLASDVKEKTDDSSIPSTGEMITSSDNEVMSTADELVTHIIRVEDDPTVSPWSFRMVFLGTKPGGPRKQRCHG